MGRSGTRARWSIWSICGGLGAVIPKTITAEPRVGNPPWRTVETAAGLLNSIGLDNDGIEAFIAHHLPYLRQIGTRLIVSIAGRTPQEYVAIGGRLQDAGGVDALELNISCPNVTGGVDFGTQADQCGQLVAVVRHACTLPILAKLTPERDQHRRDRAGGRARRVRTR